MNVKTESRADGEQSAFIEYHYYKGGLRTEFVTSGHGRPTWAPPPDWVGFRSEFVLQDSDLVIELVKFNNSSSVVSWIGLYRHSADQVFGDRQNHMGIGVWLLDRFPSAPYELIEGLRKLLELFPSNSTEEFSATVGHFLSEYVQQYVADLQQLPPPLNGMRLANNQVLTTFQYQIQPEAENWKKRLNDLFFRLYFLYPEGREENRALIYIPFTSVAKGPGISGSEEFKKERFIFDFLPKVPVAFSSQANAILELEKQIASDRLSLGQLRSQASELEMDLAHERERGNSVERQYNELKQSLAENDEMKRFSILNEGISYLKSQNLSLEREMQGLRRNVGDDIERALRKSTTSGHTRPPFNGQTVSEPVRLAMSRDLPRQGNNSKIPWIPIVAGAVIITIFIGFLFYMWYF
jgi:hypothetical protein